MLMFFLAVLLVTTDSSVTEEPKQKTICSKALQTQEPTERKKLLQQCVKETSNPNMRSLAYINLGTLAYLQHDITEAARFYDLAEPEGLSVSSDPFFHAHRSVVNSQLGYTNRAVLDAKKVIDYMEKNPKLPPIEQLALLEEIIEPLHSANETELESQVIESYLGFAVTDWIDASNRASILINIGRIEQAEPFEKLAFQAQPDHPMALNTRCYLYALTDRAAAGLGFCEKALQILPDEAALLHSYAFALAKNHQCSKSQSTLEQASKLQPAVLLYQQDIPCESNPE